MVGWLWVRRLFRRLGNALIIISKRINWIAMVTFKEVVDERTYDVGKEYKEEPAYSAAGTTSHVLVKQTVDQHPDPEDCSKESNSIKS